MKLNKKVIDSITVCGLCAMLTVTAVTNSGRSEVKAEDKVLANTGLEHTGYNSYASALTLTIPSTARRPITVAAYDANTDTYAPFSGRGYVCCNQSKPDLAAPGVDILSCAPGGGYTRKSGTSMACPFVTGSAALLMQYGIISGNDSYLYGQKVKAYLIRGARRTRAFETFPNDRVGWGMLCVADSIP